MCALWIRLWCIFEGGGPSSHRGGFHHTALWNEEPVQLTWSGLYRSAGGTRCCCWCCAARLRGPAGSSRCPPGQPPQPESEACPPPPSAPPGSGQRTSTLSQEHQVRTLTLTPRPCLCSHPAGLHAAPPSALAGLLRAGGGGLCYRAL